MSDRLVTISRYALLMGVIGIIGVVTYFLGFNSLPSDEASEDLIVTAPAQTEEEGGEEAGETVETKIKKIHLTEKTGDGGYWELVAKSVSAGEDTTDMEEIEMHFSSGSSQTMELTARRGVMNNSTRDVTFYGDVRVVLPRPLLMATEELFWRASKRRLETDKLVTLETVGTIITGKGSIIDLEKQDMTILESVKARFR